VPEYDTVRKGRAAHLRGAEHAQDTEAVRVRDDEGVSHSRPISFGISGGTPLPHVQAVRQHVTPASPLVEMDVVQQKRSGAIAPRPRGDFWQNRSDRACHNAAAEMDVEGERSRPRPDAYRHRHGEERRVGGIGISA